MLYESKWKKLSWTALEWQIDVRLSCHRNLGWLSLSCSPQHIEESHKAEKILTKHSMDKLK